MVAFVILPGLDGTGKLLADFASCFGDGIQPIVVAYPPYELLSYQELEIFARKFLPKNAPYILLGESFSGPLAISIAASRPPGLIGLVLCCTFARNPIPAFRHFKALLNITPISSKLTRLIEPILLGRFSTKKLFESLQNALSCVPASTFRVRLRAILHVDVLPKLLEVRVPILYLQAAEDRLVSPSALIEMKKICPEISVSVLTAPHLLLQVLPSEAATIVRKFIETLSCDLNQTIPNAQ